jgi:hypothetical protein
MPCKDELPIFVARKLRLDPQTRSPRVRLLANTLLMPLESDAAYTCPVCFETNYVAVDPSGGRRQSFVEDCPVCCRPLAFVTLFDRDGDALVVSVEHEA